MASALDFPSTSNIGPSHCCVSPRQARGSELMFVECSLAEQLDLNINLGGLTNCVSDDVFLAIHCLVWLHFCIEGS